MNVQAASCSKWHRPSGSSTRFGSPHEATLLDPIVTRQVIAAFSRATAEPFATGPPPSLDQLTAREVEALHMLARGLSNSETATEFVVGAATVKTHVARVLMKLGLRDRVQAVIYAYECGLVHPGTSSTS